MMEETKLHRLRVGDNVEWLPNNEDEARAGVWPGKIAAITNDEATYVQVEFENGESRELTEEEVRRVP